MTVIVLRLAAIQQNLSEQYKYEFAFELFWLHFQEPQLF